MKESVRRWHFEFIADAVDRMHIFCIRVKIVQLLSQFLDVAVYGAVTDDAIVRVDPVHQLVPTENLTGLVMKSF